MSPLAREFEAEPREARSTRPLTKLLFQFVGLFDRAGSTGRKITIVFRHDPEDDMLIEFAQDLSADYSWIDMQLVETA